MASSTLVKKLIWAPKWAAKIHSGSAMASGSALVRNPKDNKFHVTLIPGDGVGPELMDSAQTVLKSVGAPIHFEVMHLSEVLGIVKVLSALYLPLFNSLDPCKQTAAFCLRFNTCTANRWTR